ncbi:hypothetical protein KFV02_04845 [Desulfohalobiaceae bacterium Ax17]|uniref:hypothetical protein n=1 Tax=Desulfovulcanus ferrireducens TaxID=2831190 RepID=UPI00207BCE1F|nr:hypothetical protein [Desulfovulcanus ferrireducens]MBT8763256.1 hypothetical protein [Desulfovulcanus ferrireducens]
MKEILEQELDREEMEILDDLESGKYKQWDNVAKEKMMFQEVAKDYVNKKAQISIRLSRQDLFKIKKEKC